MTGWLHQHRLVPPIPEAGSPRSRCRAVQFLGVWRREGAHSSSSREAPGSVLGAQLLSSSGPLPPTPRLQTVTPAFRAPAPERGDNASPPNTRTCRSVTSPSGSALDEHRVGGNRRRQGQDWPILPTGGVGGQVCGVSLCYSALHTFANFPS